MDERTRKEPMSRFAPPDLVAAALRDGTLIEPLIAALWPQCYRVAAAITGDPRLAEDAAQEACVVVHGALRSLREPAAFDGWMYRIVVREATRIAKRHRAQPHAAERLAADDTTSIDIWRAMAALPPTLRAVVVLYYFDDVPADDIARVMRVSPVTVRTRLRRARERLRGILSDDVDFPPVTLEAAHHAI